MKKLVCVIFCVVLLGGIGSLPAMSILLNADETPAEFEATLRSKAKTADPNYREPYKSDGFQTGNGLKIKRKNRSSAMGKSSGPIPLPNAQGKLEITLLE